jgi:hypothetical protein
MYEVNMNHDLGMTITRNLANVESHRGQWRQRSVISQISKANMNMITNGMIDWLGRPRRPIEKNLRGRSQRYVASGYKRIIEIFGFDYKQHCIANHSQGAEF